MNAIEIGLFLLCLSCCAIILLNARRRGRNAQTTSNARLNRIKTASLVFQSFLGFSFLMGVYWTLSFLFGWPFFFHNKVRIAVSASHIYASPTEMPQAIFALWLVKVGLGLGSGVVLFALFQLYGQGIMFSAKNVRYIRLLGWALIVSWVIDYELQSMLHDMASSLTPVLVGLLIIFAAWIMDEGRKIQEEQALTV
jgi:hypothetical protein